MKLSECVETRMMKFFKKIHFLIKMRLPSIFEQHARIFKSNGIKLQLFPSAYRFQDQNIFQLKLDSLPGQYFFIDFDWLWCAI